VAIRHIQLSLYLADRRRKVVKLLLSVILVS
jgi:hypothetical protein